MTKPRNPEQIGPLKATIAWAAMAGLVVAAVKLSSQQPDEQELANRFIDCKLVELIRWGAQVDDAQRTGVISGELARAIEEGINPTIERDCAAKTGYSQERLNALTKELRGAEPKDSPAPEAF
ncbi:MAG TPA: hypothetical protein PLO23_10285 [Alphaproteobacteria bacterium]|nr:hypothetical protein [Alphaproteobacteria bacterium]